MARTVSEIKRDILDNAAKRGVGDHFGSGSVIEKLATINAFHVAELDLALDKVEQNIRITEASGVALDRIGQDMRLARLIEVRASALASDSNVRFYTFDSNPFSTQGTGNFALSVGDIVSNEDNTKQYRVTQVPSSFDPAADSEVYVGVESIISGVNGNINTREITRHNISLFGNLVGVENNFALINGRDREQDSLYRARLMRRGVAATTGNLASMESELNRLSGVGDFSVLSEFEGASTTNIYIQPKLGYVSPDSLLNIARQSLQRIAPYGARVTVTNPYYVYLSLFMRVTTQTPLSVSEKSGIKTQIQNLIVTEMNKLRIGTSLSLDMLAKDIFNMDSRIKSLGGVNSSFEKVEYRINIDGADFSYSLAQGERVLEVDLNQLILIDPDSGINIEVI